MNAAPVAQRSLLVVPIVHAEADLGSLGALLRAREVGRAGRVAWEQRQAAINAAWDRIDAWARTLDPARAPIRLYQDGLPISDKLTQIVADLAQSGSRNHQIVQRLILRGAALCGTESPELLLEEYALMQSAAAGFADQHTKSRYIERARDLLARRDRFIAQRIDQTLTPRETGVIFIGALHRPWDALPDSVRVEFPLGEPAPLR